MELPAFQVPYAGNGVVIGITAVLHVLISHGLAIGLLAMIVLSEFVAESRSEPRWRARWRSFARDLTKFAVVVVTGVGAVTGVGIWFTTSALAPRAIGSLLRVFFWPWAIEWLVFIAELILLLVYFFTWERWGASDDGRLRRRHRRIGVSYLALTVLGAALISGILGFMLTPGGWPEDRRLWDAFLNPSYVPQLAYRLLLSVLLGAMIAASSALLYHRDRELRREAMPLFGAVGGVAFVLLAPVVWWYFSRLPEDARDLSVAAVLTARLSQAPTLFWVANAVGAAAVLCFCASLAAGARRLATLLAPVALVAAIGFAGEYERIREFVRGPYLMPGYMYANQALMAEIPLRAERGALSGDAWRMVRGTIPASDLGTAAEADRAAAFLFGQSCSACHTIGGVNDIAARLAGRSQDGIFVILGHTHQMAPFMPPFVGRDDERRLLASFLHRLGRGEASMSSLARFVPTSRAGADEASGRPADGRDEVAPGNQPRGAR